MWDFPWSSLFFSFPFSLPLFPPSISFFLSLFNPCLLYRLVIHCLATPMRRVWRHVHRHTITCRRHEQYVHTCGTHTHTHKMVRYGVLRAEYSLVWDAHCGVRSEHLVFATFLCMIISAHYEVSCPARYPCPHSVNMILQLRIFVLMHWTLFDSLTRVLRRLLHECDDVIIICLFNNRDWLLKTETFILNDRCFCLTELCIFCNL